MKCHIANIFCSFSNFFCSICNKICSQTFFVPLVTFFQLDFTPRRRTTTTKLLLKPLSVASGKKVGVSDSGVYTIHHYQISESPGLFAKIELIRIHRRISFRALDQFTYGELGSKYCAGFERLFWCWSVWLCKWWNGFKRLQSFSGTCFRQAALKFPCNLYWNR